jgi:translocation and assembly module TamB
MIKTLKIVGISFLILLLIMAGLMLFINSSAGQKFVQKQLVSFLGNKIDTPYRIGSIKYRIPDWVVIEDIYFEDQQRDTLVMANSIRVDIDMLALIRSKIIVNSLVINKGLVKIYTPDDSEDFNYQFLADAFSSGEPEVAEPINQTSAENPFVLENVKLSDIRFYYLDKPGGMEFSAGLGNAAVVFNELNPGQNLYDISNVELQKGKLSFHSFPATVFKEDTIPATPLKINLGKVSLKEFDWKYNGEDIGIQNKVLADQADFDFEKIDLENQELVIKNAALDRSAIEVFFVQPTAVVIPAQEKESAGSWKIRLSNLDLERSAIHYRDALANPVLKPNEFNASDFKLTDANIKLKNFSFDETGLSGKVEKAEMKERSGLAIRRLDGYFLYSDQKMALNDFRLQTLLSDFDGDVNVSYPSLDAFVNDPVSARIDVKIRKGSIALKDVFRFNAGLLENKGLKENSGESIRFAGSLKGDKGNFVFNKIRVGIGKENVLAFNGFANGVTDLKKLKTRLEIEELKTSKNFYASFIPESVDLGGYQLPEEILVNGILDGNEQELKLEGRVITDLGEIALNGILKEVSSDSLRSYSGFLYTEELALNKFLGEELGVGKLTAGLNITADADFGDLAAEGTINKVEYNGYAYRDIVLNAIFKDSLLVLKGASGDPNALIDADFRSDLRANHLSVNGTLDLKNLALSELNLASLEQVIRGQFKLDLKLENSEYILGNARVQGFQLGETNAGDLEAVFTRKDDNQEIRLASGFVKADLKSIGGINRLQQYLSDFTAESTDSVQIIPDGGITLAGQLIGHPLWSELVPGLTLATPVIFGLESQNEYIDGEVSFEKITYTDFTLTDLAASLEGSRGKYSAQAELKDLDLNGYRLKKNILQVNYENDVLQAGLSIADSLGDDLHRLEFQITDVDEEQLISLKELTFDKQKFAVGENQIRVIDGSKLLTDALTLTSGAQVIRLEGNESRLSLSTENLQVAPFYRIVNGTAVKLEGLLNAKVDLNNNFSELSGEVKALLSDLEVDDEKIGDIELRIPQFTTEKIALEGKVTGPRSEAKYGGIISMEGDGNLNVRVELNKLDAALIKAFSVGQVKNAKGELYGELLVTGTFSQPRPDGSLGFRDFEVTPTYLGVPLHIDDQKIRFQDRSVIFRNFTMLDSLNQKLVFDGSVDWSNLEAISYRLSLNTSNFLLLDTQEQDNELVYGKLKLDANLRLAGVGEKPNIEGKVRVREGSDLTLVMPADIETIVFLRNRSQDKTALKQQKL